MLFKELFSIFTDDRPIDSASKNFARMLGLAQEMVLEASAVYWGKEHAPEERTSLFKKDIEVNKLQRHIRKQLVAHITNTDCRHVPYALLIMSLVKDVERLGDYAKNLVELADMRQGPLPEDAHARELEQVRESAEELVREVADVFMNSDEDRATELTITGRNTTKRCDKLIEKVASADYDASTAVNMALGARFYKRISGHALNLLSGVIMPLHKLDYFDDKLISETDR
jgi:phosphate uptake regulator